MNDKQKILFSASSINITTASPDRHYMFIKMKMLDDKPNRNGDCVTAGFIKDIAENKNKYIGMALCADVNKILNGDTNGLSHLLDRQNGEFLADQIGAFVDLRAAKFSCKQTCL